MHQALAVPDSASNGIIKIIPDPEDPGTVSGCDQTRCGRSLGGAAGCGRAHRPGTIGSGRIDSRKSDHGDRSNHFLRESGSDCDPADRIAGIGAPDFRCAALGIAALDQTRVRPLVVMLVTVVFEPER